MAQSAHIQSAGIRRLLDEQPSLTPREIQAELASQGVEVTRNLCKVVRHRELRKRAEPVGKLDQSESKLGLRRDERQPTGQIGAKRTRPFRLTGRDMKIWECMKAYADSLDDPSTELHKHGGDVVKNHPKVLKWIGAVSTWRAIDRRHEIRDQFVEDLKRLFPPLRESSGNEYFRNERLPFPPDLDGEPDPELAIKKRGDSARSLNVESEERRRIHEQIDELVSEHDRMLDVFFAPDSAKHLLSIPAWHRWESLKAIANSYSVVSALNDLLALAWDQSKLTELPKVLSEMFLYEPDEEDGSWMKRPDVPALLFLLALWCVDRIQISKLDENGQRHLTIGKTARL